MEQTDPPAKVASNDLLGAWLPIETAPRDSKARLVWVPENACQFCVTWSDARGDEGREGWCIFGGGWREYLQRATLWQPLPAPPRMNEYGELRQAPNAQVEADTTAPLE